MYSLVRAISAASLLLAASAAPAAAQNIALPVTYEDFLYSGTAAGNYGGSAGSGQPDFQSFGCGLTTGLAGSTLVGGVPVFGPNGSACLSSAASFSQWYQNTPGINVTLPGSLALSNIGGNTYHYGNSNFFPIDGQGFNSAGFQSDPGLDSNLHNFAFTTQWTGEVDDPLQDISITSADDAWLFADGHLIMDLGGVHGVVTGSAAAVGFLPQIGASLGDNVTFDVFYAQRHTIVSEFDLTTDIAPSVPEPGTASLAGPGIGLIVLTHRRRPVRLA
jgi:fibro-slime domain-containing protein